MPPYMELSPGQIPDEVPDARARMERDFYQNLSIVVTCPECQEVPPKLQDTTDGDTICDTCGLVLGARIVDTRSEWRTFANDDSNHDDPNRVGSAADPLFYGSQLETHISYGDGGARARDLHRAQGKLQTDSNNKNLKEAYIRISTICQSMHLTDDAIRYAQDVYKQVHDQKPFKGKHANNTIAGCLFIACRKTNHDRPFKDFTDATGVSRKDIGRAFKSIMHYFKEQKKTMLRETGTAVGVPDNEHGATDPAKLAQRYCQDLLLPARTCRVAAEVAEKFMSTGVIAGRSPISIAAVAVYFASHLMGNPKSPKDIARVAPVSDGTIRTSYKQVYPERVRLIEPRWIADGGELSKLPST